MGVSRRKFLGEGFAAATAGLASGKPAPASASTERTTVAMKRPRLIYYNDAHHFNAKRIDPPATVHKMQWPVDEVIGTGVELLVFGLGYGDVYFHDSKLGRVVGQEKEVWQSIIDWRIMRMVEEARKLGTDQLREVLSRGSAMGLAVFPSLKLQDGNKPGHERCGWLKWKHGRAVCTLETDSRHPGFEYSYDFANPLVREDKKNMIREMLEDYRADGIELDFMFFPNYFRKAEIGKHTPLMSRFVAEVREMTREIGREQNRDIPIVARVFHRRDENLKVGLDVETWLGQGSVDIVVGQIPYQLFEPGVDVSWLGEATQAADAAGYVRPPLRVYDERTAFPSIEMYRALLQHIGSQGCAGMYLGYLPWPFSQKEREVLREMAYPEAHERRDKRYFLQPREPAGTFTDPPARQLPAQLKAGETTRFRLTIADDLRAARRDAEMRQPILTLRFQNLPIEDEFEIRLNGEPLPLEKFEITDERALRIPVRLRKEIESPLGFAAHWLRYRLDPDQLRSGENILEVETKNLTKTAGWPRYLNGVEIQTRYKDFVRPEGIGPPLALNLLRPNARRLECAAHLKAFKAKTSARLAVFTNQL